MPDTFDQQATTLEENQSFDNMNNKKSCLFPHDTLAPELTTSPFSPPQILKQDRVKPFKTFQ